MNINQIRLLVLVAGVGFIVVPMSEASSRNSYGSRSGGYDHGIRRSNSTYQSRTPEYKVAIKRYDPVAYFEDGEAVKGKTNIYFIWRGKRWHFANRKHEELFIKNPEKYAPQYDGYCAFAVSQGSLAKANPKIWSVVDGKLYLNLNKKIQKQWDGNQKEYIMAANKNWPSLR